jgi:hypothetical protein
MCLLIETPMRVPGSDRLPWRVLADMKRLRCAGLEGGNHRVVGRPALGILEWSYGLDRPYRPRLRRLGAVPLLQQRKKRELV